RPAREAGAPDAGSLLGGDVAALPRVLLRPADRHAGRTAGRDLAAAARRVARRRADPDHALDARVRLRRDRRPRDDVPARGGNADDRVEAAAGASRGHLPGAGAGDELCRQPAHRRARTARRPLGDDGAHPHERHVRRGDACLGRRRSGHPVARRRSRPRRPCRRRRAADDRPRPPAARRDARGRAPAGNVAGVVAAIVIHRLQSQPDIRGSSTEEFTLPTTTAAPKPPSVPGIQWSQYGYDAEHSRSVSVGLAPPFRKVWWYGAGSLVEFPPVVGYGRIYFSTNSGKFAAVSLKTGKRAWRYFSHRCVAASPALGTQQHGTVYAVFLNRPPCNAKKGDGRVIAFSAGLGRIRWQKKIGPSETSPVIDGNRLYVGDWNGSVWALDARSGRTLWRYRTHGAVKGAAALSGGRLYVGSYDGHVYCLAAATGRVIWKASGQSRLFGRG